MTRLGIRGRKSQLAALSVAALTSVAMLATTASTAATPALDKDQPSSSKSPKAADRDTDDTKGEPRQVELQMLALNDFHGQLEPSTSSSSGVINGVKAGGAEYLATHLETLRQKAAEEDRHSVTVAAGDLIGATPLLSAAFHDEPTIEAMNQMGLEVSSVGNHEFDEGWRELVRMQEGGCLPDGDGKDNQNSCPDGEFEGADFQYLSANVFHEDTGETVLPGVEIKEYDGVPVAFVGMTLENTPNIVTKAGVQGLEFTDEVETANRSAKVLHKQGVKSIVVLVHEGGFPADRTAYNSCPGISGPIVDINDGLSPKIDVVVTGHTHSAYNCALEDPSGDPRLVTSAASIGRLVTDIDLTINSRSREINRESAIAENVIVTRDVAKSQPMTELIAKYAELVAPIANEVIGELAGSATVVSREQDDSKESPLGNLIADAQKADASLLAGGAAPEIAFMNPGGIRADLIANDAGEITYGRAFDTQPFNNYDVAMDMTGAQILELLEQQFSGVNAASPKVLQVSGIEYTYSSSAPAGSKVVTSTVKVNGVDINEGQTYRVAANSFLSDGGDGFPAFAAATNKYIGGLDIDALAAFLQQPENTPYTPVATDRIDVQP